MYDVLVQVCVVFFFFQAEDGIRDLTVTGVQTCALPICMPITSRSFTRLWRRQWVSIYRLSPGSCYWLFRRPVSGNSDHLSKPCTVRLLCCSPARPLFSSSKFSFTAKT